MGKRRTGRKLAMQILYQSEVQELPASELAEAYLDSNPFHPETRQWAIELAENAWEKRESADALIKKLSIDWDFSRISPIDKSLLRLAFYELCFTQTPLNIVLDEAIELAKKYSTDDSPKFINGILGKYVETHVHRAD